MSYFLESGYLDMPRMIEQDKAPFVIVMNGRGTGKTFGALQYVIEHKRKFILMRRTQTQVELMRTDELSPFKTVNRVNHWGIVVEPINKYVSGVYDGNDEEKTLLGYILALSTFSNLRGFDASDVKIIIYDEFIPEPHDRPIKQEGNAFLNCYESINRNRELEGQEPLKVLLLSNTNTMYSPILESLGVLSTVEKMKRKGKEHSTIKNLVSVYMPVDSPISEAKKSTVLYQVANNGDFVKMAIDNTFSSGDTEYIESRPIKEYIPLVAAGGIVIYRHKSNDSYYVTENNTARVDYGQSKTEKLRFNQKYAYLYFKYIKGKIRFQNFAAKLVFEWYYT